MPKKEILKNGVRLISIPLKETATATLLIMIGTGSRYENSQNSGVSHFIEHLMFKGTKKRPNTLALSKELDGVGAEFNAFTGKDYTGYYIKSDSHHLSLAIDVLSDMLINSKFDPAEIKREKGVIIEEINMYEDNPLMYIDDLLEQTMFDRNPLGRSIAGSKKTVRGLNRKEILKYKEKFYSGDNIVIGLAGNFNSRHIPEIKNKFAFSKGKTKIKFSPFNLNQKQSKIKLSYKSSQQAQLALGFPAYSYSDDRIYPLQLLSIILGGNMSSRLFLSVRERQGLAYFVRSSLSVYQDIGGLIIQAGLDKIRMKKAITLIVSELKKIKKGVNLDELKRAKDYLAGKTALDLEDTSHLSQWYSQQELLIDKILTPSQKIKKIMSVSRQDVARVAKHVINFNRISLAIIGPFKNKDKFKKLLK